MVLDLQNIGRQEADTTLQSPQIKICWFVVSAAAWSCWRLPLTNLALSASRDFGFWCGNGPEGMGPGAPNAALQHLTINIFVHDFFALILQHVKTKLHCLSIYLL